MLVLVAIAVLGGSPGLSNAITGVFKNIAATLTAAV
jgi:Flp pilus assembly pilin Flp